MSRFKVGDIIDYCKSGTQGVLFSAKVIDQLAFNIVVTDYPSNPSTVGRRYAVNLFDACYRLRLTKEEKFTISKNRVESRHLRKKVNKAPEKD